MTAKTSTLSSPVALDRIINKFDVRTALDDDRVLQFIGMYEAGVELPPVKVVELADDKYAYIDGRTRGAALIQMGRKTVDAIIVPYNFYTVEQLYREALQLNYGGAKPPTRSDITHTVIRLLESGSTPFSIKKSLDFLPRGAVNSYIATAQSMLSRRRIAIAIDSVAEGENIDKAAAAAKIDVTSLRVALKGKNKGYRSRTEQQERAHELQLDILHKLQSANLSIGNKVSAMLQDVEHGEMSPLLLTKVLHSWSNHLKRSVLRVEDWKSRLNNITSGNNAKEGVA